MNRQSNGFTLIELMITVAIIGVLVAVAVPVFRGYALRAKISEAMVVADLLKSALSEVFVVDGSAAIPVFANRVNNLDNDKIVTKKISAVTVNADPMKFGHITITLGGISELPSTANSIAYSPHINSQTLSATNAVGVIQWVCAGKSGLKAQSLYPDATILPNTGLEDNNIPDVCR